MQNDHPLLKEASACRADDPHRSLELCNRYLDLYPEDGDGLFVRHHTWSSLGRPERALDDINAVLRSEGSAIAYFSRACVYRELGDHERALIDLARARLLDDDKWLEPLDLMVRADCYAWLERLDEAMADCAFIPEDYRAPAFLGLPAGDKQEVIQQIRARALAARARG